MNNSTTPIHFWFIIIINNFLINRNTYFHLSSLSHAAAPSDYLALSDVVIGPFTADNTVQCFSVTIVRDTVCEGEVDEEGYPRPEVFNAVVRSEEGSSVEVRGSRGVATITIEESAECSKYGDMNHCVS